MSDACEMSLQRSNCFQICFLISVLFKHFNFLSQLAEQSLGAIQTIHNLHYVKGFSRKNLHKRIYYSLHATLSDCYMILLMERSSTSEFDVGLNRGGITKAVVPKIC